MRSFQSLFTFTRKSAISAVKCVLCGIGPVAALSALSPGNASAGVLITNLQNSTGGFQTVTAGVGGHLGQAFTVGTNDVTVTGAVIRISPATATDLANSSLSLVDNTTGATLGTFTLQTPWSSGYVNYSYTLATPVTLTGGGTGGIEFAETGNSIRWSDPATTTNTSNGVSHLYQYFGAAPAAAGSQRPTRMLSYELDGTVSSPEPTSLGLLATVGLLTLRRRNRAK